MRAINASIPFDKRLWRQDIAGSKAHVAMLGATGIVSAEDAATISAGPDTVAAHYAEHGVAEDMVLEDIHMQSESRLAEAIGQLAQQLGHRDHQGYGQQGNDQGGKLHGRRPKAWPS